MIDYPQIVYKYRSWEDENHKKVISENSLFLAPPILFNDPFDCRLPDNIMSLDTDEKIEAYVELKMNQQIGYIKKNGLNIEEEKFKFFNRIRSNPEKYQQELEEILFKSQDKHIGVLSLSARWNSILMWSHYGNNHKGFCVGFYEEKIRTSGKFGMGGIVDYNKHDDYPFIDPLSDNFMEKSIQRTHSKSKEWIYEEEYRTTKTFHPNPATKEDRIVNFDNDFFAEIVLGINISEKDKDEIIETANKKGIKIYQAKKVPFKFLITREEIK